MMKIRVGTLNVLSAPDVHMELKSPQLKISRFIEKPSQLFLLEWLSQGVLFVLVQQQTTHGSEYLHK